MFSAAVLEGSETASVITGHSMLRPYPDIESPIIPEKDAPRGAALLDVPGGLDFHVYRVRHVE
jgi:hypothetical protein